MRHTISVILFFAAAGCAGPAADKNEPPAGTDLPVSKIPANAIREKFADTPELERITINDGQGVLKAQGILLDGKKEGAWTEFYSTGTVKSVTPFVSGRKEGTYVELNENGQFSKHISFHNNLRHGAYSEFSVPFKKEERAYQLGKLEGIVRIYYPDGKIMEESNYKNDTRDGISRWYGTDGKVSIEYEYKNGELVKK